jgi:hypothetical protein
MQQIIKFPKDVSDKQIEQFFINRGLKELVKISKIKNNRTDYLNYHSMIVDKPYKPELRSLYRLFQYITLNKRTTILEFGSGWSTFVILLALNENKVKYLNYVKKYLRRKNPFELFVVENTKKFLNITKERIKKFIKKKKSINTKFEILFSECKMTTFNGLYASEYSKLPLCNPDFIFLDGPSPFDVKKRIHNFTTAHSDLMPMSCDILKFEHFLIPNTMIIAEGRGANVQFLRNNFKRKWLYFNDKKYDLHVLLLNSPSFGNYNNLQLKFYKS